MHEIYSRAQRVITYLGTEEDGDVEALNLLTSMHNHFEPYYGSDEVNVHTPLDAIPQHLQFPVGPNDLAWQNLERIVNGAWARPVWMIQENLLNQNTVMMRGTTVIPWMMVASIATLSTKGLLPRTSSIESSVRTSHLQLTRRLVVPTSVTGRQGPPNKLGILQMLLLSQHHLCFDRRDKIYGLLGIANDSDDMGIMANYSLTIEEVFIDAALRILCGTKSLSLLNFVSATESRGRSLPSWVPAWTGKAHTSLLNYGNASGDSEIRWADDQVPKSITLHGISVDTIADVLSSASSWFHAYQSGRSRAGADHVLKIQSLVSEVHKHLQHQETLMVSSAAHCCLTQIGPLGKSYMDNKRAGLSEHSQTILLYLLNNK